MHGMAPFAYRQFQKIFQCRRFQGHLLYGIRSVAVYADRLRAVVSECGKASKSFDARDKYFMSYVGEFDSFPSKALRSELPALDAATASLAATASELADTLPLLGLCRAETLPASSKRIAHPNNARQATRNFTANVGISVASQSDRTIESGTTAFDAGLVDAQNGLDVDALDLLLNEARASIIGVRKVLA